jgi:hypothetical protein
MWTYEWFMSTLNRYVHNRAYPEVTWTHDDFEEEEIDFPTEEGAKYIRGILGCIVIWNKEDIILEMPMSRS